jgi:hypothetical protein
MFAIDFLSDVLGKEGIKECMPSHVAGFANFIAYIVNREIDLSDHMNHFSIESMVKDGVFGNGCGIGYGEHLIPICL